MDDMILRPSLFEWLSEVGEENDISEVVVGANETAGSTLGDVTLPNDCTAVLVRRDGEYKVPGPDTVIREGDRITLLGTTDAVEAAVESLR
ncbi:TrkA C-terminal domain-containing protein [Haladaptatus halobius]|uniref:TrkA C-terminal domain-containing protein n=1 Tax=Haladaptatus halobius TaxID=2884875 RepID=UPI0034A2B09B